MARKRQGQVDCFLCQQALQPGPFGHYFEGLDMTLCGACLDASRAGIPREHEGRVIKHLESRGLPVPGRTPEGLLRI